LIGVYPNSYAISTISELLNWRILAGRTPILELPADEAISLEPKENEANVYGCGLVMDPNDKLAIFFTLNGILMGQFILNAFQLYHSKKTYKNNRATNVFID
jgi:hypothetical protein